MSPKASPSDSGRGRRILTVIIVLIILTPFGYSLIRGAATSAPAVDMPFLERPAPQYDKCVRDLDYMRYHHWELLRGVREEVVRYGVRSDISLNKCRECHTSRERFCNRCHDATSLKPDCFGCHYYP